MARIDTRDANAKRLANHFEVVKAEYVDPNGTAYDRRIAEVELEAEQERLGRLSETERHLERLRMERDKVIAEREKAELAKQYTAEMYVHPTVRKLTNLLAYYESDESVDAKLLQRVSETIQQWTDPTASRIVAEKWAAEVFETESKRRADVEAQLNAESTKWNERAAALRNARVALADAPDTTPQVQPQPVSFEKSVNLKSTHPVAAAYELWLELPAGEHRDAVDAALVAHKRGDANALPEIIERYAVAAGGGSDAKD